MDIKGLLLMLSLAALSFSISPDESVPQNCSSKTQLFGHLANDLELIHSCFQSPPAEWSSQQLARMLLHMRNLTDKMHKHHLTECEGAEPKNCTAAEVPENGGLACITIAMKRFCRPLCNHGFDFNFIKGKPTYVECSERTRFQWNTQYVGGNKLAICNWSARPPPKGKKNMFFPKNCLATKKSSQLTDKILQNLTAEVHGQGILGEAKSKCLLCG